MRTTLKRGTSRIAESGNGRPGVPLAALSPVTRYRAPRRGPLRLVGKILLWLFVCLLVAAGALAGGAWLFINQSVEAVRAHSREVIEAEKILDVAQPNQPTVAIVIGYDKRAGANRAMEARSDTVMLVRADPQLRAISMLSFPRDLVVEIPGCRGHGSFVGRINEAYTYCGPKGTLRTVKELTGIPINYMVTVNFRGFRTIVDKLGGVYVDVDRRYFNDNSGLGPGQTYATINLKPGYQRLSGTQALDYVRYRHTDSDLYRVARQQAFVKALKQQVSGFWSLSKIPGIVNTITKNVEVGVGGGKTLDVQTLYGYAKLVYGLPAGNFHQPQIEGLSGYAELTAPETSIQAAVDEFMRPDPRAAERAARSATGKGQPTDQTPPPKDVTVEVLNGNGVAGAADDAAYRLGQRGYQVANGGNADTFDYFETVIRYDPAAAGAELAARELADLFGDAEVESAGPSSDLETMVQVIVGQTFQGHLTPVPQDRTPERQPPVVSRDPTHALGRVRAAQKRVDFRLYVPTIRERGSSLDFEVPARAYEIDDHDGFRLTYRTSSGEYWGIQQTNWTDAPALQGPSLTQEIGQREYKLFFNGPRLHMVAFEENGAAYWVVNTLLDRMSNETMLAIAKGLRAPGGN
jgi:LCP family protein required for cell wall assembly